MQTPEKTNRGYIVWSIVMGLLLGFIVNVFSSVYYGMFITGDLAWSQVNHQQLMYCVLALIALVGYLMFFIADYPNTFEFSKAYWKRFQQYFFYSFWPGKIMRWIIGVYLLLFLLSIFVMIYLLLALSFGGIYGTISFVVIMALAYIKEQLNRKHA